MSAGFASVVDRLLRRSGELHRDPYRQIQWPQALPMAGWCMPPELMSLYGTPVYDALDAESRRELSRLELIHFFSLNIHGEARLIAGLGARRGAALPPAVASYLARFQEEESKHRACFIEFCGRYARGAYGDRNIELPAQWSPDEGEFVFFARVLMFEELVDHYNGIMARDERVVGIVRQVNRAHHVEEARHLAFGRGWLRELAGRFHRDGVRAFPERVIAHLGAYRVALWRDLFNPDVYRDAGLADPLGLRNATLAHPATAARRHRVFAATDRFLAEIGCLLPEVVT